MGEQKLNSICKERINLSGLREGSEYELRFDALIATMNCIRITFETWGKKFGFSEEMELIDIMRSYVKSKDKNVLLRDTNKFLKSIGFRSVLARKQILDDIVLWCEI